jgi:hypothetical protein
MKQLNILLLFCSLALIACTDDDAAQQTIDLGFSYQPADVGSEWIYKVDSFSYDDNTGSTNIDTFTYWYKEVVAQKLSGNADETERTFLINRFFKYSDSAEWKQANSWRLIKSNTQIEKIEENISFIKLLFPLASGKKWNGNMANSRDRENYTIIWMDAPFGGHEQTCKVEQFKEKNLIEEITREEIFARETGLVYKVSDSLNSQVKGTRGYRVRYALQTYKP